MPRYFFTIVDGRRAALKNDGLELTDHEAAWSEATSACGELLRDLDGRLRPGDHWSMQVKDERGRDIYLLEFKTTAINE
jgi:hypothetical protein